MDDISVKMPFGWITDKSVFYILRPKITVKIEPIGNIKTNYDSLFESAGINQTRHKIYVNVIAKLRLILPFK